jgi:hypothetical protein
MGEMSEREVSMGEMSEMVVVDDFRYVTIMRNKITLYIKTIRRACIALDEAPFPPGTCPRARPLSLFLCRVCIASIALTLPP